MSDENPYQSPKTQAAQRSDAPQDFGISSLSLVRVGFGILLIVGGLLFASFSAFYLYAIEIVWGTTLLDVMFLGSLVIVGLLYIILGCRLIWVTKLSVFDIYGHSLAIIILLGCFCLAIWLNS